MKLSWTYYPKGETQSVTLTVIYVPELDKHNLSQGGFLNDNTNAAYVDWATYRIFDKEDIKARQEAFARLVVLAQREDVIIDDEMIQLPLGGTIPG